MQCGQFCVEGRIIPGLDMIFQRVARVTIRWIRPLNVHSPMPDCGSNQFIATGGYSFDKTKVIVTAVCQAEEGNTLRYIRTLAMSIPTGFLRGGRKLARMYSPRQMMCQSNGFI